MAPLLPFDILVLIVSASSSTTLLAWSLVESATSRFARVTLAKRRTVEVGDSFASLSEFLKILNEPEQNDALSLPPLSSLLRSLSLTLPSFPLAHLRYRSDSLPPIPLDRLTLTLPSSNFRLSPHHVPLLALFSPRTVVVQPPPAAQWVYHFHVESSVQRVLEEVWGERAKEWRWRDCNPLFDASMRRGGGVEMVYKLTKGFGEEFFRGFVEEREREGVRGGRVVVGSEEVKGWVGGDREGWGVDVGESEGEAERKGHDEDGGLET